MGEGVNGRAPRRPSELRAVDPKRPETQALLMILALGNRQIAEGEVEPAEKVVARLRERRPSF